MILGFILNLIVLAVLSQLSLSFLIGVADVARLNSTNLFDRIAGLLLPHIFWGAVRQFIARVQVKQCV